MPQTTGITGWIVLTYDNSIPVCLWISTQECRKIPLIVDERLCGDTFIRVEKIGNLQFVVSDIWMYNSNCVFACSTFRQRYEWLKDLISTFTSHVPGTVKLIHKSDLQPTVKIRGYEEYSEDKIGSLGYFSEAKDPGIIVNVTKLSTPDCYIIDEDRGYMRVPDIGTSFYLRSLGDSFKCRCVDNQDGSWSLVENIPEVEVNAA